MYKEKTRLLVDTDIGDDIDDAYALAMLLASREVEVCGVTTVYRNSEQRAKIARALCDAYGQGNIPVVAGEDFPTREAIRFFDYESRLPDGRPVIAHYVDELMGGYEGNKGNAAKFMLDTFRAHPHKISLLAIGPLTNVAKAAVSDPAAFALCKEIYIMGGDPRGRVAEWNFRCDPEAAETVFRAGVPIRLVGIDVTCKCGICRDREGAFLALPGKGNGLLAEMLKLFFRDRKNRLAVMHDGLVASAFIRDFCTWEKKRFRVVTEGARRAFLEEDGSAPEIEVAVTVDSEGFIEFLYRRLLATAGASAEAV